jgi:hypothetical protein
MLSVRSVYSPWIVLRKRVGIRPLLIDKLSSIPIPQDGAIAPEGFVLLPIVERINYQYDDQLWRSTTNITINSWPGNRGWSQLTTGHWNCSSQQYIVLMFSFNQAGSIDALIFVSIFIVGWSEMTVHMWYLTWETKLQNSSRLWVLYRNTLML